MADYLALPSREMVLNMGLQNNVRFVTGRGGQYRLLRKQ